MELVSKAIIFATKAHDGMRRKKSEVPYIIHPLEAAVIVSTMTDDQEVIASAVLHDVVEDTPLTLDDLRKEFPEDVVQIIALLTHDDSAEHDSEAYFTYIRNIKEHPIARKIKLADIAHNSDQSRCTGSGLSQEKLDWWKQKYQKALKILME